MSTRTALIAAGFLIAGLGGGYLFATEVLFPAPEPPETLTEVPDLHGMSMSEATEEVLEAGLVLTDVDSIRHPSLAEGAIVGQSPLAGQRALPGDTVRLTMSLGPDVRLIPDVFRVRSDRARAVLEATGFQVVIDSVESDSPRGTILSANPEPGTEIVLPGEVELVVSLGPPQVEMPVLLGLHEEDALALVDSLGLTVSEVGARFRFGLDQGMVIEQEPEPGVMLERGSAVRIVVGRRSNDFGNIRRPDPVESGGTTGVSPHTHAQLP